MASEDILSSHRVDSQVECSLKCLVQKTTCVGFNYKHNAKKHDMNCQTSANTTLSRNKEDIANGEWMFFQVLETLPVRYALIST